MTARFAEDRLAAVIESALRRQDYDENTSHEIAFHMTDWLDDLEALLDFYERPGGRDPEFVYNLVMQFLVHAPNHLNAAHKLLMGDAVTDVFGIGAVKETGPAEDE